MRHATERLDSRRIRIRSVWIGALLGLVLALPASAQQWNLVGSRFQGMGGAGVGTVNDSAATYWNAAALGFKKKGEWDVQLPVTLNANIENRMLQQVSSLANDYNALSGTFQALESGVILDPVLIGQSARATADWLSRLNQIGTSAQSVHAGIGIGLLGHFQNFGFSALSNSIITVFPNVDLVNVGFDTTGLQVLLDGVPGLGSFPGQEAALKAQIDALAISGFWSTNNANNLVDAFIGASLDPSDPTTRQLVLDIANIVDQGTGSFLANTSGALGVGLSIQEFGLSYGHTIPMPFFRPLDDKISIGGQVRYMLGIAYVNSVVYANALSAPNLLGLSSSGQLAISHNVGIDLSADIRPFKFIRVGVQARNINAPKFSAGRFGDIQLFPQVRLGTSITPIKNLIVAMDVDLTENQMQSIPTFRSRVIGLGTEYTIPISKLGALGLRFGAYNNMSDVIQNDWALTGGLGLKLSGFVLDLSGGASLNSENIRTGTTTTIDVPTRINLGLGVKWEKSI